MPHQRFTQCRNQRSDAARLPPVRRGAFDRAVKPTETICIDFDGSEQYDTCVRDKAQFRSHLESWFRKHPLLFPPEMASGFTFHDNIVSAKQDVVTCRIRINASRDVYQIRPAFVMPSVPMIVRQIHPWYLVN